MVSEITRLKKQITEIQNRLNNPGFLAKAKINIINDNKKKLHDNKALLKCYIENINLELAKQIGEPFITYFVEEIRLYKYSGELFSPEYFIMVNNENITDEEKEELLEIYTSESILKLFESIKNKIDIQFFK